VFGGVFRFPFWNARKPQPGFCFRLFDRLFRVDDPILTLTTTFQQRWPGRQPTTYNNPIAPLFALLRAFHVKVQLAPSRLYELSKSFPTILTLRTRTPYIPSGNLSRSAHIRDQNPSKSHLHLLPLPLPGRRPISLQSHRRRRRRRRGMATMGILCPMVQIKVRGNNLPRSAMIQSLN